MSYERLAYDDADSAGQMHDDCTACGPRFSLPRQRIDEHDVAMTPREAEQHRFEVSEAAATLASRLHLHLD